MKIDRQCWALFNIVPDLLGIYRVVMRVPLTTPIIKQFETFCKKIELI